MFILFFFSDDNSVAGIRDEIEKIIANIITGTIVWRSERWKLQTMVMPRIRVEFVDIDCIRSQFRQDIHQMKNHFFNPNQPLTLGIDADSTWTVKPTDKYESVGFKLFFIFCTPVENAEIFHN